jgi:hypothetical protein
VPVHPMLERSEREIEEHSKIRLVVGGP